MAYESILIPPPVLGLNTFDATSVMDRSYTPDMKNIFVERSYVRKRRGYSSFGTNTPLPGTGMEIIEFVDGAGTKHLIALTTACAVEYNAANDEWDNISPFVANTTGDLELEDCEDNWTAGAGATTANASSAQKVEGTNSILIDCVASVSDGDLFAYENFDAVDLSAYSQVRLSVRPTAEIPVGALEIVLSESADGAKTGTYQVVTNASVLAANTWNTIIANLDIRSLNAVVSIGIYANHDTAFDSGVDLYIDAIYAQNPFTTPVTDRWSFTRATNPAEFSGSAIAIIISSGTEGPYYYTGSGRFTALTLSSDFTDFNWTTEIAEFWNYLFCLNYRDNAVTYAAHLVYHDLSIPDVAYASKNLYEVVLTDTQGEILRMLKLGYDAVIYNDLSVTVCQHVGGDTLFVFPTIAYATGLLAPRAVVNMNNRHVFLGTDQKIYAYEGGTFLTHLGILIEQSLFGNLDIAQRQYCHFAQVPILQKLFMMYPAKRNDNNISNSYPYRYFVLNYERENPVWEFGEFADPIMGFSTFRNTISLACNSTYFTDASRDACSDSVFALYPCSNGILAEGFPSPVMLDANGYTYNFTEGPLTDDGTAIDGYFTTTDITTKQGQTTEYNRWGELSLSAKTTYTGSILNIFYSTDEGVTWIAVTDGDGNTDIPLSVDEYAQIRCPIDVVSQKIRFKIQQSTEGDFYVRGLEISRDTGVNR